MRKKSPVFKVKKITVEKILTSDKLNPGKSEWNKVKYLSVCLNRN